MARVKPLRIDLSAVPHNNDITYLVQASSVEPVLARFAWLLWKTTVHDADNPVIKLASAADATNPHVRVTNRTLHLAFKVKRHVLSE